MNLNKEIPDKVKDNMDTNPGGCEGWLKVYLEQGSTGVFWKVLDSK